MTGAVVEINGAKLFVTSSGQGPPVVMVHAGIADSRMWDPHVPALEQVRTVVRYDARGFGRSDTPPGPYSMAEDLGAVIATLGLQRPAIVGCSMGGSASLQYVLGHPEAVECLVLVASAIEGHEWSPVMDDIEAAEEAAFEAGDVDRIVEINLSTWVAGPDRTEADVDPGVWSLASEMIRTAVDKQVAAEKMDPRAGPAEVGGGTERRGSRGDVGSNLVVVGDKDVPDMLAIADRLERTLPSCRRMTIEGAAHLPNLESPEKFTEMVLAFLGDPPREGP